MAFQTKVGGGAPLLTDVWSFNFGILSVLFLSYKARQTALNMINIMGTVFLYY